MDRMKGAARACIAILLVISLTACAANLGRTFDEGVAQQIKSGETTKAQLLANLGQPALVTGPDAEEVWTYAYYRGPNFGYTLTQTQGIQKRLIVKFMGDSVKEWQFREEIPQADRANR